MLARATRRDHLRLRGLCGEAQRQGCTYSQQCGFFQKLTHILHPPFVGCQHRIFFQELTHILHPPFVGLLARLKAPCDH